IHAQERCQIKSTAHEQDNSSLFGADQEEKITQYQFRCPATRHARGSLPPPVINIAAAPSVSTHDRSTVAVLSLSTILHAPGFAYHGRSSDISHRSSRIKAHAQQDGSGLQQSCGSPARNARGGRCAGSRLL